MSNFIQNQLVGQAEKRIGETLGTGQGGSNLGGILGQDNANPLSMLGGGQSQGGIAGLTQQYKQASTAMNMAHKLEGTPAEGLVGGLASMGAGHGLGGASGNSGFGSQVQSGLTNLVSGHHGEAGQGLGGASGNSGLGSQVQSGLTNLVSGHHGEAGQGLGGASGNSGLGSQIQSGLTNLAGNYSGQHAGTGQGLGGASGNSGFGSQVQSGLTNLVSGHHGEAGQGLGGASGNSGLGSQIQSGLSHLTGRQGVSGTNTGGNLGGLGQHNQNISEFTGPN